MEFEPKIIPEGINTSKEHPLREFFVLVCGLAAVVAIVTALLTVSTDYLVGLIPLEIENRWFSEQRFSAHGDLQTEADDPAQAAVRRYLQTTIERLRRSEDEEFRFTAHLVDSDTPNAFVLPGGQIFVTRGLLQSVSSENGLAMVLAHEMAHQYHRHPLSSLGRGLVISLALTAVFGADNSGLAEVFVGNAALLTSLSFNREQEREADSLGAELLIARYGHAAGSADFFETMKTRYGDDLEPLEFFNTHPDIDSRFEMLRDLSRQYSGELTPLPESIDAYLAAAEAG